MPLQWLVHESIRVPDFPVRVLDFLGDKVVRASTVFPLSLETADYGTISSRTRLWKQQLIAAPSFARKYSTLWTHRSDRSRSRLCRT